MKRPASSARRRRSPPCPPDARLAVVDSVALGVSRIYLICAGVMACAIVVAILLPERPLQMRAGLSDAMEDDAAAAAAAVT